MAEPVRVLQVMATLDRGGAEAVVMDWLRLIDREQVVFDFVVNDDGGPYVFEKEALQLGARIIRAPRFKLWNAVPYGIWWYRCLVAHPEWQIVHAHHTVPATVYLMIARLLGRETIAHSHTSGYPGRIGRWARRGLTWPLRRVAETHVACSNLAAHWMFGRRTTTLMARNGVNLERFSYSSESRSRVRRSLGLKDQLLVGHVGRFEETKNHERLLRIFAQLLTRNLRARLILVGDGTLRGQVERQVNALGLTDRVSFVGVREDVPALLSAMDVLVLPSHFEGLPVSVVEAQASGLRCVVSAAVTKEVELTDLVSFVPLDEPDYVWADAVLQTLGHSGRRSRIDELRAAGYDSAQVAEKMQLFYLGLARKADTVEWRRTQ